MNAVVQEEKVLLKLDLGCGPNPKDGFVGLDSRAFNEKVTVTDLSAKKWYFEKAELGGVALSEGKTANYIPDNSVGEFHCSHFLEHLTGLQRVSFFNELYRIMSPGAKGLIITPHWSSNRAYGDFTHQWPPVSEMGYYYINKDWRKVNAPHNDKEWNPDGYDCDFDCTWGYGMHQNIQARTQDYQNYAMTWYKEACQDMHCTVTSKKPV